MPQGTPDGWGEGSLQGKGPCADAQTPGPCTCFYVNKALCSPAQGLARVGASVDSVLLPLLPSHSFICSLGLTGRRRGRRGERGASMLKEASQQARRNSKGGLICVGLPLKGMQGTVHSHNVSAWEGASALHFLFLNKHSCVCPQGGGRADGRLTPGAPH